MSLFTILSDTAVQCLCKQKKSKFFYVNKDLEVLGVSSLQLPTSIFCFSSSVKLFCSFRFLGLSSSTSFLNRPSSSSWLILAETSSSLTLSFPATSLNSVLSFNTSVSRSDNNFSNLERENKINICCPCKSI